MADQPEVTPPGEAPKTIQMTQAEFDKAITDRLARQETTIKGQYADYDTMKADSIKLKELEKANETDAEKRIREAREQAEAIIPTRVQEATAAARTALVESAIRMAAVTAGFKYPDDVVAKLSSHKDVSIGDDFKVKGVDKLVEGLATERPEWLGTTRQPFHGAPPRTGATPPPAGAPAPGTPEAVQAEQLAYASRRQALGIKGTVF